MVCVGGVERQRRALSGKGPLDDLPLIFEDWIDLSSVAELTFRERLFSPSHTFWLFLSQAFSSDGGCDEAVRKALCRLVLRGDSESPPSASTSAYCQARKRLPGTAVSQILNALTARIEEQPQELWLGHAPKVVDGSTFSMPDTEANQKHFGQPSGQKAGCGFPMMRAAALFSLSTGALLARACGPYAEHERALWRKLWGTLAKGDVVLADRGFCGFADFHRLQGQGADCVMRLHQKRAAGVREIERLGKDDHLVEWMKMKKPPDWISKEDWKAVPAAVTVRHVTFSVSVPGFRTKKVTVATTLLDPKKYPANAFADLYRRRWRAEVWLGDLKTTMGIEILRCKTPEMIGKELDMHLIAYNLIRALMLTAANRVAVHPDELSFKQSLNTIRQWTPAMVEAKTENWHREMLELLYHYLAASLLTKRPNRSEPRAVKRRPKNYQRLTAPRKEFKECFHRSKYKKPTEE